MPGEESPAGNPEISLRDVGMVFERTSGTPSVALESVDLDVAHGQFVTLVGASGCGKTTLLRIMSGLTQPTSGTVAIGGRPDDSLIGRVSVVFQADTLLPWRTVAQNIAVGLEIQRKRVDPAWIDELIELVGLAGFRDNLPKELSGGMRQRVNLARALATDPDVLLMDEPFAALDAQTREVMQQELLRIWARDQKTVVFVTHQIDEALFLADRVIVMGARPGRVVEDRAVPYPRPRSLDIKHETEFMQAVGEVWRSIRGDVFNAVEHS